MMEVILENETGYKKKEKKKILNTYFAQFHGVWTGFSGNWIEPVVWQGRKLLPGPMKSMFPQLEGLIMKSPSGKLGFLHAAE